MKRWIIFGAIYGILTIILSIIMAFVFTGLLGLDFGLTSAILETSQTVIVAAGIIALVIIFILSIIEWSIIGLVIYPFVKKILSKKNLETKLIASFAIWDIGLNIILGHLGIGIIIGLLIGILIIKTALFILTKVGLRKLYGNEGSR